MFRSKTLHFQRHKKEYLNILECTLICIVTTHILLGLDKVGLAVSHRFQSVYKAKLTKQLVYGWD